MGRFLIDTDGTPSGTSVSFVSERGTLPVEGIRSLNYQADVGGDARLTLEFVAVPERLRANVDLKDARLIVSCPKCGSNLPMISEEGKSEWNGEDH